MAKDGKTTKWGALSALGIILMGVAAALDGNPETVFDLQGAIAAVGVIMSAFGLGMGGKASKDAS